MKTIIGYRYSLSALFTPISRIDKRVQSIFLDRQYLLNFVRAIMYCYKEENGMLENAGRHWIDPPKRGVSASSAERSLLLGVIASHLGTLDTRDNDSRTVQRKSLIWELVTKEFNSRCLVPRSKHQIQTLFKNMKAKARKYQVRLLEADKQSDNVIPPEPDPISGLLIQLLAGEHAQRLLHLERTAMSAAGELASSGFLVDPSSSCEGPDDGSNTMYKEENDLNTEHASDFLSNGSPEFYLKEELPETLPLTCKTNASLTCEASHNGSPVLDGLCDLTNLATKEKTAFFPNAGVKRSFQFMNSGPLHCFKEDSYQPSTEIDSLSKNTSIPSNHEPLFSGNKHCCPLIHRELVALLKQEHDFRMKILLLDRQHREEQHRQKMKILHLEEHILASNHRSHSGDHANLVTKTNINSLSSCNIKEAFQNDSSKLEDEKKTNAESVLQISANNDNNSINQPNFASETSFENLV